MRVELTRALNRSPVQHVGRVERHALDPLRYIGSDEERRAPRRERSARKAEPPNPDARFESTASDSLSTTLVELQLAALPTEDEPPRPAAAHPPYGSWTEV